MRPQESIHTLKPQPQSIQAASVYSTVWSHTSVDEYGQIAPVYLFSSRTWLSGSRTWARLLKRHKKRASYVPATDDEAVEAFEYLSRTEGVPPLNHHAAAYAKKIASSMGKDKIIAINPSREEVTKIVQPLQDIKEKTYMNKIHEAFKIKSIYSVYHLWRPWCGPLAKSHYIEIVVTVPTS